MWGKIYFTSLQQHLHRRLCKRNRPSLGRQLCLQLWEAAVYAYKDRLLIIKSSLFKRKPDDLRKCKIHAKLQNAKLLIQGRRQPLFVMLPLRKIAVLAAGPAKSSMVSGSRGAARHWRWFLVKRRNLPPLFHGHSRERSVRRPKRSHVLQNTFSFRFPFYGKYNTIRRTADRRPGRSVCFQRKAHTVQCFFCTFASRENRAWR